MGEVPTGDSSRLPIVIGSGQALYAQRDVCFEPGSSSNTNWHESYFPAHEDTTMGKIYARYRSCHGIHPLPSFRRSLDRL